MIRLDSMNASKPVDETSISGFSLEKKIELFNKIIVRTDSYHNYANTKSTIIITFISALIVSISANIGKALDLLSASGISDISIVFKLLSAVIIIMLFLAFFTVIETAIPYINKSKKENIYSFIDTNYSYASEEVYEEKVNSISQKDILEGLVSLQYNLSHGLVEKYKAHKKSINLLKVAVFLCFICSVIIFYA